MRRLALYSLFVVLLFPSFLTSCSGEKSPPPGAKAPVAKEIRKEYGEGPFTVRILADRDSLSIAESLVLTIEAENAPGYGVELPRFGEKLGEFGIRDYREDQPRLTPEGRLRTAKTYTLDPFLSGDYTISPMQVRFQKKSPEGEEPDAKADGQHVITTEEITIKVNSLLGRDPNELTLNPVKGPVPLPSEPLSLLYTLLGVGAAACIAGGIFFVLKRRGRSEKGHGAPDVPAHERAMRQLQEILAQNLIERGESKLFFSRISDVVRSYIENRFGIRAPRRTTEEFLTDISRKAPFAGEQRGLLMEFLLNCDLVKFAEHSPSALEIEKAVESCKAFIEATRARSAEESQESERKVDHAH
jgi:hypothetical protein